MAFTFHSIKYIEVADADADIDPSVPDDVREALVGAEAVCKDGRTMFIRKRALAALMRRPDVGVELSEARNPLWS